MAGKVILIVYALWNGFCLLVMFADKRNAVKHKQRVPEKRLIACVFAFGALGIATGMVLFNHKTNKKKFVLSAPLGITANILCIVLLLTAVC